MSSKGNKSAKRKLIKLYGPECWVDKLKLRPPEDHPKRYTSKAQLKRAKQLTFHHIKPKREGGQATVENGALLSVENHEWFNSQPPEIQDSLNKIFQDYKQGAFTIGGTPVGSLPKINYDNFISKAKSHYNRAKVKRELQKIIEKQEEEEWEK